MDLIKINEVVENFGITSRTLRYGGYWGDDMVLCDGCHTGGLDKSFNCDSLKCAVENDVDKCQNCYKYPCDKSHHLYHGLKPEIHTNTITADDITRIILPYVYGQYGN